MTDLLTMVRVIDVETTGLEQPAEIVELGWTDVRLFPNEGWAIESKAPSAMMVNPGMPISFGAMATHHITEDDVFEGASPQFARDFINAGVEYFAAHNALFDRDFIKASRHVKWICTMKCAKTLWPYLQSFSNGAVRYERKLCLDETNIGLALPSHRAGPDTWVTAHILLDLLKVSPLERLVEISENPLQLLKMPFGKWQGMSFRDLPLDYLDWVLNKSDMPNEKSKEDVAYTVRMEIKRRELL